MNEDIKQLDTFYKSQKKILFKIKTDQIKSIIKKTNINVRILALNMNKKETTLIALLHQNTLSLELLEQVQKYLNIK